MTDAPLDRLIEQAADRVAPAWPITNFVTTNPLMGFQDRPFHQAVHAGARLTGARGYPSTQVLQAALDRGEIDRELLQDELAIIGRTEPPEELLAELAEQEASSEPAKHPATAKVDHALTKWLSAFLEQGQAAFPMPGREDGFYAAIKRLWPHDRTLPDHEALRELPEDPRRAIEACLADQPRDQWEALLVQQLFALPGWTGFIRHRIETQGPWQEAYPITLAGYLAARLTLTRAFEAPLDPSPAEDALRDAPATAPLAEAFLRAWEASYREPLVEAVTEQARTSQRPDQRPAAQLVLCIDTRSEVLRRHLEATGPYETHGYAGFFGIPMRHQGYDEPVASHACPPIATPEHRIETRPNSPKAPEAKALATDTHRSHAIGSILQTLKTNPAAAFSYVEMAGPGYALWLVARTLAPRWAQDTLDGLLATGPDPEDVCRPQLAHQATGDGSLDHGIPLEAQVTYARNAIELMGLDQLSRLVVFTGHGAKTANNPFEASLDCGACAGNRGGPNARLLAAICNDPAVQRRLEEAGIEIPEDTVFLAAEHTTTTDEVTLYDEHVPDSHAEDLERLRRDLATAQARSVAERAPDLGATPETADQEVTHRAADWSEPRPEWGLAGNAAFIVGPRHLTADLDLEGRCFLHSYDPAKDPHGEALEAIMTGPMVVTQWINAHYYFATVDNEAHGSGSKVTQNPTGNIGVHQGPGGDLRTGLPWQSVYASADDPQHRPIRLSVLLNAPVQRITDILERHDALRQRLDNGWLSLVAIDPDHGQQPMLYAGQLAWEPLAEAPDEKVSQPPPQVTP